MDSTDDLNELPFGYELPGPTPPISLETSIDSPVYRLSSEAEELPRLKFTITNHLGHPITLYIPYSPLDERRAWDNQDKHYQNFTVTNITTNRRVWISGRSAPNRCRGDARIRGGADEKRFMTLLPNVPVTISHVVHGLSGWYDGLGYESFVSRSTRDWAGEVFDRYFEPGNKYWIGVAYRQRLTSVDDWMRGRERPRPGPDQMTFWWRYGTKEQVLEPPRTPLHEAKIGWSENKFRISGIPDVELAVEE